MKFSVEEVEAELDAQVTNDSNNTASTSTPSDPVVNNHPLQNDFEQFCESYYAASSSKPNKGN